MLARRLALMGLSLLITIQGLVFAAAAWADPLCDEVDSFTKECKNQVKTGQATSQGAESAGSGGSVAMCDGFSGEVVPCWSGGKRWINTIGYCTVLSKQQQVGKEPDTWLVGAGNWDEFMAGNWGSIVDCNGYYVAIAEDYTSDPPDPAEMARGAIARLDLRAIEMGLAPKTLEQDADSLGAVGLPVWMWAASKGANTTGPNMSSTSARGYTVSLTAKLKDITWDMGDGSKPVVCGIGTAYKSSMGYAVSPTCGYRYEKEGEYTVTATSHWVVEWEGIGQSGVIPVEVSRTATVRIGEIQVVSR